MAEQFQLIAVLIDEPRLLGSAFRAMLSHSWISSYQVGFGPPLVRANSKVTRAAETARSVLDKLEAYLEFCLFDSAECRRLAELQEQLVVRRFGASTPEQLDRSSREALDLSLRLYSLEMASGRARASMQEAGISAQFAPIAVWPDDYNGRFVMQLSDPMNRALLNSPKVRGRVYNPVLACALELRVSPSIDQLWVKWLERVAPSAGVKFVPLGLQHGVKTAWG